MIVLLSKHRNKGGKTWNKARRGMAWQGMARNKGEKLTAWNRQHKILQTRYFYYDGKKV
jgi:hypothetical protein